MPPKLARKSLVTQSNKLTEARYFLTIGEQKIILLLISLISPEDTDLKDYEMKVSEFSQMMGLSGKSIYERMDDTLDKLLSRVIHIPEKTGFLKIGWVSSARYIQGEGVIQLSFDKKLKPYLLQLKEQFTKYNLFIVAKFQSSYSVRIYMLLKQYEKIGYREFYIDELKEILGIDKDKYSQFKAFRQWVINQAKKEFETKNKETGAFQSDITFDLETIRTGRKITRLRFNIRKQKYQEQLPFDMPEVEPLSPAMQALIDHKIGEALARKFQAEQGEEDILRCVVKYEAKVKAGKVENPDGGYLLTMLEGRAGKQSKAERIANELQEKKQVEEQQKAKQEAMQEAFKNARNGAIADFLEGLDEEQQSQLIQEFEGSQIFAAQVKNNIFVSKRYESDGVGCAMVSPLYKRFIKDAYLPNEYQDIEQWRAMNA